VKKRGPDLALLARDVQTALREGRTDEAEAGLAQLRLAAPGNLSILLMSAKAARARVDLDAAAGHIRAALRISPRDAGLLAELAQLLDEAGKGDEAVAAYDAALALQPGLVDAQVDRAVLIARKVDRELGLGILRRVANSNPTLLRAWRNLAVLEREALDLRAAKRAVDHVLSIQPADKQALRLAAVLALEAGEPAAALYRRARTTSSDPQLLLGEAGALVEEDRVHEAIGLLESATKSDPNWVAAHRLLAELRWQAGGDGPATASYTDALKAHPKALPLWLDYIRVTAKSEGYARAHDLIGGARAALGGSADLDLVEAEILCELDACAGTERLFERVRENPAPAVQLLYVRWLTKVHRFDEARERGLALVAAGQGPVAWPYVSLAWRVLGDPRWEWLERNGELAVFFDLEELVPHIPGLADHLRGLHRLQRQPLGQSVRGGTQTGTMLFAQQHPHIRRLVEALERAVRRYIDGLPPQDTKHPLLAQPRNSFRFTGSWSVRLLGSGFHVSHIHSRGSISSAFYVALPQESGMNDVQHAGWLSIGEPPSEFGLSLRPLKLVEPKPGRLVLFPSWTWHGTRPFSDGERLTVAFDIALG